MKFIASDLVAIPMSRIAHDRGKHDTTRRVRRRQDFGWKVQGKVRRPIAIDHPSAMPRLLTRWPRSHAGGRFLDLDAEHPFGVFLQLLQLSPVTPVAVDEVLQ